MKRILVSRRVGLCVLGALALVVGTALATPNPNSSVFILRVFNDCPSSTLTTFDNYPAELWIDDANLDCYGYANLHVWRYSEDDTNPAVFNNDSNFRVGADIVLNGTGEGEGGMQVAPWWSQNADGKFNCRTTDGEIACFGGRLPFYSFTAEQGLRYVKGSMIHLEMIYYANDLSEQNPATIEYKIHYNNVWYTSGPRAFDMGNPAEPYGLWGMLNDGRVGGYVQPFVGNGQSVQLRGTFRNIIFENLDSAVPTVNTTWGTVKGLFR